MKAPCRGSRAPLRSPSCSPGEEDLLIGARQGTPLAIGYGEGEMFLGSDAMALAPFTDRISYLEEGDWAVLTRKGAEIYDANGRKVERRSSAHFRHPRLLVDKGNHRHFMAKEIHEQPEVISHTLAHYLDSRPTRSASRELPFDFAQAPARLDLRLRHGLLRGSGRQVLVRALCAPAGRDRYRLRVSLSRSAAADGGLALFVSQSGETADTLATLRYCQGAPAARAGHRQRAAPPPSRANPTPSCRRSRDPKSASPPPRRSPASLRCWLAWRSRRAGARRAIARG